MSLPGEQFHIPAFHGHSSEKPLEIRVMKSPADIPAKPRNTPHDFSRFPKDYRSLCCDVLLPRPLHSRKEYRAALNIAETMAGHNLTKDQDDYL
ncbi:hypothetical protein EON80_28545, partial [bacterium]